MTGSHGPGVRVYIYDWEEGEASSGNDADASRISTRWCSLSVVCGGFDVFCRLATSGTEGGSDVWSYEAPTAALGQLVLGNL